MSVPIRNSYVVVWIDPAETLEHLDDEEVRQACSRLECGKYVAVVTQGYGLPIPGLRYHSYSIDFVVQGLPTDDPGAHFESAMSCPILPNTCHPEGRRPLRAIQPLPWPDCYHRALYGDTVKFRLTWSNARPSSYLNFSEIMVLQEYLSEDSSRIMKLERHEASGECAPPRTAGEMTKLLRMTLEAADKGYSDRPDWEEIPTNSEFDQEEDASKAPDAPQHDRASPVNVDAGESYTSSGSYTDDGSVGDEGDEEGQDEDGEGDDLGMAVLTAMLGHQEDGGMLRMVMNVSYDLSLVDSPPDPAGYFKEVEAIIQIEEDFKQRMLRNIEQVKRQDQEYIASLDARTVLKAPGAEQEGQAERKAAPAEAPKAQVDCDNARKPSIEHAPAAADASEGFYDKSTEANFTEPPIHSRKKVGGFAKTISLTLKRAFKFCWPKRTPTG